MISSIQKCPKALIDPRRWALVVKSVSILLGAILLIEFSTLLYPPLYVLGLALIGRSPLCSSLAASRERGMPILRIGNIPK
jgi:hypothetical protein